VKYLIAGLGNIGAEYDHTRHNIGFDVVDHLARLHNTAFNLDRLAYAAEIKLKGRSVWLIKPTTYMNLSGKASSVLDAKAPYS
jgi:PTH1 family peptidyl-tRNA hydrolase